MEIDESNTVFICKSRQRIFEQAHRSRNNPGTNLPHSRILVSYACINPGCDLFLDHLADINTGWRTAEVKEWNGEHFMFCEGDFVHIERGFNGILRGAANESHQGGSSSHGKTADSGCLGDYT